MAEKRRRKNVLLAVLVLGIVVSLLTPAIFAAPKTGDAPSSKQATIFDPFAMQTVALASGNGNGNGVVPAELKLTRRSIRIPFRPAMRSAFCPVW